MAQLMFIRFWEFIREPQKSLLFCQVVLSQISVLIAGRTLAGAILMETFISSNVVCGELQMQETGASNRISVSPRTKLARTVG